MRVTTKMFYNRFLADYNINMESIFKSQEQIVSNKKVNRPSDDPAAISRIVNYNAQISSIGAYRKSISSAMSSMGAADTALIGLNDLLIRAKELALQGANATYSAADRIDMSKEVDGLLQSAMEIANTKVGNQYVFAGYKSTSEPIDKSTGEYLSDSNELSLKISASMEVKVNVPGSKLFSFKRNSSGDPASGVLPSYSNDADPNGAVYSSQRFFVITSSNNKIAFGVNGDATVAGTATINTGMYTGDQLAAEIEKALETADAGHAYNVTYDTATSKFTIANPSAGNPALSNRDLLWGDAATTAEGILGFNATNSLVISNGGSDTSDRATTLMTATDLFTVNGGTLKIKVGDNSDTSFNVTIPANSTLAGVKDAINNANAGVKADVINIGTTALPDYRIVISSNPAGKSGQIRITASTSDPAATGLNTFVLTGATDLISISDMNNKIQITEGGVPASVVIPTGEYTADQLALALKESLESATNSANIYTVNYDSINKQFEIIADVANTDALNMQWEDTTNTTAASILGYAATVHSDIQPATTISDNAAGSFVIAAGVNDQINIVEGTTTAIATIAPADYSLTPDVLALRIKDALENATASSNTYTVTYDAATTKFKITSDSTNKDRIDLLWEDAVNTTAAASLGFNAVDHPALQPMRSVSDNSVSYGMQNQDLHTLINNYNYITDTTDPRFYSFNNNYLNGTIDENGNVQGYIFRAISFLKISLENNDVGRINMALEYITQVSEKVYKVQAEVGARMNHLDTEDKFHDDTVGDIKVYLSNDQDTDIAKAATDMAQRQSTLQALRTASAQFMQTSLFDFLR